MNQTCVTIPPSSMALSPLCPCSCKLHRSAGAAGEPLPRPRPSAPTRSLTPFRPAPGRTRLCLTCRPTRAQELNQGCLPYNHNGQLTQHAFCVMEQAPQVRAAPAGNAPTPQKTMPKRIKDLPQHLILLRFSDGIIAVFRTIKSNTHRVPCSWCSLNGFTENKDIPLPFARGSVTVHNLGNPEHGHEVCNDSSC